MSQSLEEPDNLGPLRSVLNASRRNFTIIAHRARSDGNIHLNDLCGASGRWDGISRAITASLFLSHDMRRDTSVHILLLGPDDPPKLLSLNGSDIRYLNPDERASSALMKKCLKWELGHKNGMQIYPSPGIILTRADLADVIHSMSGNIVMFAYVDHQVAPIQYHFPFIRIKVLIITEDKMDIFPMIIFW